MFTNVLIAPSHLLLDKHSDIRYSKTDRIIII